tara:strand:- start:4100 stop:4858 length:759 start_codon:yes stop_codon:yes gene_type:complete
MSIGTSISTNVKTFTDCQRALEELKKKIDEIELKQNPKATGQESDSDEPVGSTRVLQNSEEESLFEIKTEQGWKRPMVGLTPVIFKTPESASKTKTKETIDKVVSKDESTGDNRAKQTIIDESTGEFSVSQLTGIPRPDYDSGWIDVDANGTTGSGGTLTHNLGEYPQLAQAWFVPDADYNSGDPAKIFLLSLNVGMRHQDNWAGVSAMFTKNTMQYWLYKYVYIVYGVYNDPMANGWDKFEEGYMRVFLWK